MEEDILPPELLAGHDAGLFFIESNTEMNKVDVDDVSAGKKEGELRMLQVTKEKPTGQDTTAPAYTQNTASKKNTTCGW